MRDRPDEQLKYRADIDGLRAVAVLAVLAYHAYPNRVRGGFVGVDVFFVISGFLISRIIFVGLDARTFSFFDFYARRIRRIFPALLLVLGTSLSIGWFMLPPEEYASLGKHTAAGAAFVSNLSLWQEAGYFDAAAETKPLLHLWSLGVEEQFYLVWPLLLVGLWRWPRYMPFAIVGIGVASFVATVLLVVERPSLVFYSPFTRFWELLVGSLLAYLTLFGAAGSWLKELPRQPVAREICSWVGLLLIVTGVACLSGRVPFPGFAALLPVVGATAMIAAGPIAWLNRRCLGHPALVFVGVISYPLYLWHWPFLVYARQLNMQGSAWATRWVTVGLLLGAVVAAYATYRLVELRVRNLRGRALLGALGSAMAILCACGLAVTATRGADFRYNTAQNAVVRAARDAREAAPAAMREGTCFLRPDQGANEFASACTPVGLTVLLWGDSHAAQLYPALAASLPRQQLAQLTASACPPLIDVAVHDRPHCADINRFVVAWVARQRPRTVVLAGNWSAYPHHDVTATLRALKAAGVETILTIGPFAMFTRSVPLLLIEAMANDPKLPERLTSPMLERLRAIDARLRDVSAAERTLFASPLAAACPAGDCLVTSSRGSEPLLIWDVSHVTAAGAAFAVRQVIEPVLKSRFAP
jgi:peptidoglycan/LPS O-acetylase OafA/YrhL